MRRLVCLTHSTCLLSLSSIAHLQLLQRLLARLSNSQETRRKSRVGQIASDRSTDRRQQIPANCADQPHPFQAARLGGHDDTRPAAPCASRCAADRPLTASCRFTQSSRTPRTRCAAQPSQLDHPLSRADLDQASTALRRAVHQSISGDRGAIDSARSHRHLANRSRRARITTGDFGVQWQCQTCAHLRHSLSSALTTAIHPGDELQPDALLTESSR